MPEQQKPSRRRIIAQDRAALAWEAIRSVHDNDKKGYASRVKGLPAMIQINGLASTVAFLNAKKGADANLANHIATRILQYLRNDNGNHHGGDLMTFIRRATTEQYRRATAEAIEYAIWLKRYVEAEDWGK
jgi:CRISPR type III-B/RAMP module-associated protein Cmr5